jgi:thioesterase domain-containing protein
LASLLEEKESAPRWSSLVAIQPSGSRPPFFCVHANGGHVLFYRDLAFHMAPDQPFYGLQSIGLDGKQPPLTRIEEMAAHYIEEIQSVQPRGPYFLGGFCLGAYIALEIAHQLQSRGEEVGLLVSINTDGAWRKARSFRQGIDFHTRNLARLGPAAKLNYIAMRTKYRLFRVRNAAVRRVCECFAGHGRTVPPSLLPAYVFEVNTRASRRYVANAYKGRLTYFQGNGDTDQDPRAFWGDVVTGGVEVHSVPGKYIDVLREPNVKSLAAGLQSCLNQAQLKLSWDQAKLC